MTYFEEAAVERRGHRRAVDNQVLARVVNVADGVILKILQARLLQYVKQELPDIETGFRKGRRTKLPTSIGS